MTLPEEDLPVKRCTHCGEEKPLDAVPGDGPAARARSGRGRLMALPVRREDGRWFVRGLWGYPTEAAARAAAKELWRRGSAVRVEARGGRWDVWWAI